ncbi:MAG: hypothetical protein ACP5U2_04980 [Bryobacteraceae bacterium]
MKRWLWWLALPLFAAQFSDLSRIRTVYLLPMGQGLDQYLAGRLTRMGLFQVVTDPKKADAVFTDRLGEAFEQRMRELYPPESRQPAQGKTEEKTAEQSNPPQREEGTRASTWGRGRGTIFLVDTRSRTVVWSVYERPRNSSPEEVERAARRIAERLMRDLKKK